MLSQSEENYLKCIYSLELGKDTGVSTSEIASKIGTKASSVTDMLNKLSKKGLLEYQKYYGASLSVSGKKTAALVVRKHRLWELFLVEKLNFKWDKVHDIAEQLEHVESDELVKELDRFLGYPKYDPHGDPIPDEHGNLNDSRKTISLMKLTINDSAVVVGVEDSSSEFLRYLEGAEIILGTKVTVKDIFEFDDSRILIIGDSEKTISGLAANKIIVRID